MKDFTHVNIGRRRFLRLGVFASIASSFQVALHSSVGDPKRQYFSGTFTPIEAFNRMLTGSKLEMVQHEESGLYTIKKIGDLKINADVTGSADTEANNPFK